MGRPTHLNHFIRIYDDVLPSSFLTNVLSKELVFQPCTINDSKLDDNIRRCVGHSFRSDSVEFDLIWNSIDLIIKDYCKFIGSNLSIQKNSDGYSLIKYCAGGFYREHVDMECSIGTPCRILSIIILLNDDFDGGELSFFNDTYVVNLKRNQAIVFPSNFMFPHQVRTISKGSRYSIVTWVS